MTVGVLAALVAPVAFDRDGFPLSTYPMYSRVRAQEVDFVTAQAVAADGEVITLTLGVIGDSDDPLIVAGELRDAIRDGRAGERCIDIAERARGWSGLPAAAIRVEVVTERRDVVTQVRNESSLVDRTIHASCEIPS